MAKSIIKLNRGDSFEYKLFITEKNDQASTHLLLANEAIYFALLYPNQPFEDAILIKGYTSEDQNPKTGEILVKITPNDTKALTPGVYYYTVKLQRGGTLDVVNDFDSAEEARTLIERTKFIINE